MAVSVLIVEDDRNIAELLQMYLEKEGYAVTVAADGGQGAPLWRGDFTVYQAEAKSALEQLKTDQEFIAEQQRFYPGVDIGMSMEKAYCNFWGIPDGWEYKKRQRSRTINWKSTYRNALSLKSNQVAAGTALHQEPRPVKPIRLL
mgnify:CR=1 FL=1